MAWGIKLFPWTWVPGRAKKRLPGVTARESKHRLCIRVFPSDSVTVTGGERGFSMVPSFSDSISCARNFSIRMEYNRIISIVKVPFCDIMEYEYFQGGEDGKKTHINWWAPMFRSFAVG